MPWIPVHEYTAWFIRLTVSVDKLFNKICDSWLNNIHIYSQPKQITHFILCRKYFLTLLNIFIFAIYHRSVCFTSSTYIFVIMSNILIRRARTLKKTSSRCSSFWLITFFCLRWKGFPTDHRHSHGNKLWPSASRHIPVLIRSEIKTVPVLGQRLRSTSHIDTSMWYCPLITQTL